MSSPCSHYSAGSGSDSQTANIDAVAIGRAGGRDIVVSGSDNGIVRVWDAGTGEPIGEPLSGHFAEVNAVAIGRPAAGTSWSPAAAIRRCGSGVPGPAN